MGDRKLTGTAALEQMDAVDAGQQRDISPWCNSFGKRFFDLGVAAALTLLALPIMAAIAVLVRLTSTGPVLFRQYRLGKDGTEFQFFKFRTMAHELQTGPGLTKKDDARVTRFGRFLRLFKLDELPQLFHVLSGKMSLVGPRPDLPKYLAALDGDQLSVLTLRPGLTGSASVSFSNEEEIFSQAPEGELEAFYVTHVLPAKVRLDLEYAKIATLGSDVGLLFQTVFKVFGPGALRS